MDTIKHTLTLYPSKSSEITTKSQTFQKTIRLLAEHNSIWHFAIYQSKDSSPLNVINIFWSIFNTHYAPSSIHLRSTHQNHQRSQLNHRHFRKLSDFSRNTIQFDTLRFTNKNTSRLYTQSNIFWSIFNTHYGHHQAYPYALPIKILRDHN